MGHKADIRGLQPLALVGGLDVRGARSKTRDEGPANKESNRLIPLHDSGRRHLSKTASSVSTCVHGLLTIPTEGHALLLALNITFPDQVQAAVHPYPGLCG